MQRPRHLPAIAALSVLLLGSCSSASLTRGPEASGAFADAEAPVEEALVAQAPADTPAPPAARPQLIRRANIRLEVESALESRNKIEAIVSRQGGDILGLQESQPSPGSQRSTVLRLRVPQASLNGALDELAGLGTVLYQEVTAEDVTSQLVDLQARLKNLRRAEDTLLEIMERSGSASDVLEVARELANTRQTIEQIDASLKNLRNQVAFSSIEVYVVEAQATTPIARSVSQQLRETWQQSTRSLKTFSTSLLRWLVWIFVFSPYWLAIGILLYCLRFLPRRRRRKANRVEDRTQASIAPTKPTTTPAPKNRISVKAIRKQDEESKD